MDAADWLAGIARKPVCSPSAREVRSELAVGSEQQRTIPGQRYSKAESDQTERTKASESLPPAKARRRRRGGKAAAMEPGTMERMVALTESALNESYAEPSPYAWLRTRAPVPTTYAPACDPLYPFQEILENRTSRARGMTDNCAEVPSRKCLICIEIWQVELEDGVWRVSFHKYAYVHGDPIQGIDPTGEFLGFVGLGLAIFSVALAMAWTPNTANAPSPWDETYADTGFGFMPVAVMETGLGGALRLGFTGLRWGANRVIQTAFGQHVVSSGSKSLIAMSGTLIYYGKIAIQTGGPAAQKAKLVFSEAATAVGQRIDDLAQHIGVSDLPFPFVEQIGGRMVATLPKAFTELSEHSQFLWAFHELKHLIDIKSVGYEGAKRLHSQAFNQVERETEEWAWGQLVRRFGDDISSEAEQLHRKFLDDLNR